MRDEVEHAAEGSAGREKARHGVAGLINRCIRAYRSFAALEDLAEDLRILSLNAELLAGRTGDGGRAIRVLTQYTRELVTHLKQVYDALDALESQTFAAGAASLKEFHRLRLLERSAGLSSSPAVRAARERASARAVANVRAVVAAASALTEHTRTVTTITTQSKTIAVNIAIEATWHGGYGQHFASVAETMRTYARRLEDMSTDARGWVGEAMTLGAALSRAA